MILFVRKLIGCLSRIVSFRKEVNFRLKNLLLRYKVYSAYILTQWRHSYSVKRDHQAAQHEQNHAYKTYAVYSRQSTNHPNFPQYSTNPPNNNSPWSQPPAYSKAQQKNRKHQTRIQIKVWVPL